VKITKNKSRSLIVKGSACQLIYDFREISLKDFQLRLENFEPRIPERIMTLDPKGTHIIGSWNLGEMI
jgi:hypothetical protein